MKTIFKTLLCASIFILTSVSLSAEERNIAEEFEQDTARLEKKIADMLESDYSTMGMIEAANAQAEGYDALLNKYYKILMQCLTEADKKVLRESQRNWIKFRDGEYAVISGLVASRKYTGGGTMWGPVSVSMRASLIKQRLMEIYAYIDVVYPGTVYE
ncbi:lysozyme inhibitor LprI family protein [Dysgonomonas sp. 520]|uniref:lysozyme inhibitor LprI family protein n=1 Tax=Dysgonomonas sp. 520 TaxID=2302931 RepID=UPI0013D42220|nr:lysozyme inhibitor LprI family protein [Dysgonomonas sp. 520]NDW10649.1 DUF1311 domain-containing protein [Dysgonomonas sp. 520]